MKTNTLILLFLLSFLSSVLSLEEVETWSGEWGVHLAPGVDSSILNKMGLTIVKQIGKLDNAYLVKHSSSPSLSSFSSSSLSSSLVNEVEGKLYSHPDVIFSAKQHRMKVEKKFFVPILDPLFVDQWHLNNTGQLGGSPGADVNIVRAWEKGYNGEGVRIAIVDDGFQYIHPDLTLAYEAETSYNFVDQTSDPSPGPQDAHGTSAAGVALARNNSACGVGAAYQSSASGIRLLSNDLRDAEVAMALSFYNDKNDIYSNSWGPYDDGETIEGPGYFTKLAMENGLNEGRNKLGSIFVWAAGNGLEANDNCNYDGYANHRGTIAVGAIDNKGVQSYYSEPCSAMLIVAPSNSIGVGITTTDLLGEDGYDEGNCTNDFGGTSSACPLVAGIVALMLQANPDLTWRDVQHILLSTADMNDENDSDWSLNGAKLHINHKYGFGRVNAYNAVHMALNFESLASSKQTNQTKSFPNSTIPDNNIYGVNDVITIKKDLIVEHVEVTVNIPNFYASGDLRVVLVSPMNTTSVLAEQHGNYNMITLIVDSEEESPEFVVAQTSFGANITAPISGKVVIPEPYPLMCSDVISNITNCNTMLGNIVFLEFALNDTVCNYTIQAANAQQCGAIAVVFGYNISSYPPSDDGYDSSITIPSVAIARSGVNYLLNQTATYGNGNVSISIFSQEIKPAISFDGWTFSTVRNWGESAKGNWRLEVYDQVEGDEGQIVSWTITVYGRSKPTTWLPPWGLGIIIGVVVIAIFIISFILYRRSNRHGFQHLP